MLIFTWNKFHLEIISSPPIFYEYIFLISMTHTVSQNNNNNKNYLKRVFRRQFTWELPETTGHSFRFKNAFDGKKSEFTSWNWSNWKTTRHCCSRVFRVNGKLRQGGLNQVPLCRDTVSRALRGREKLTIRPRWILAVESVVLHANPGVCVWSHVGCPAAIGI